MLVLLATGAIMIIGEAGSGAQRIRLFQVEHDESAAIW